MSFPGRFSLLRYGAEDRFSILPGGRVGPSSYRDRGQCSPPVFFFFLPALLITLGAHSPARGLEWTFGPSLEARGEYNDNIRLTTTATHDAVWMATVVPRLRMEGEAESSELRGDFRYEPRRYSGGGDLDSDNFFANIDGVVKSEFDEWGLDAAYRRDSTIQSELLDTGITDVSKVRWQKSIAPSWRHVFSEFLSSELGYSFAGVSYENGLEAGLFDYSINTFNASISRLAGEFDYLRLNLYYSAFDAPLVNSKYGDRGLLLGFSHIYSDYYRFDASGGVRRTKFSNAISENESSTGFIGEISLTRVLELSSAQVTLGRKIDPSGSGTLMQRDSLVLSMTRRFTAMVNGSLALGIYRNKSLEQNFTRLDRSYFFMTPSLTWRVAEDWSLRLFYRYQYSKYDEARDAARANVAGVKILYKWPSSLTRH